MCELLGMAFNETVQPNFSFRGFIHRGSANPDGWGIAYYPNGEYAAQVIKEPLQSNHSSFAAFLKDNKGIRSRIFISHVRLATSSVCYTNTHPFSRVLGNREYVFAHNGHLSGNYRDLLAAGRWNSMGTTDSEYAFCHLMHIIENRLNGTRKASASWKTACAKSIDSAISTASFLTGALILLQGLKWIQGSVFYKTRSSLFKRKTRR